MSLEIIDILIIGIVLFFTLLVIFNRVKTALTKKKQGMCSGCEDKNCSQKR